MDKLFKFLLIEAYQMEGNSQYYCRKYSIVGISGAFECVYDFKCASVDLINKFKNNSKYIIYTVVVF